MERVKERWTERGDLGKRQTDRDREGQTKRGKNKHVDANIQTVTEDRKRQRHTQRSNFTPTLHVPHNY